MRRFTLMSLTVLLSIPAAFAASFRDVPTTNQHRVAIDELSERGVISGNPDGTFRPLDPVNRAAMLKMLYVASNRTPQGSTSTKPCFPDVPMDSWFATYVCDAAARGFVKGYGDGLFWPGRPVSRAEALKLTQVVLGIPATEPSEEMTMYTDVATGDWFYEYVKTAMALYQLPISGQELPLLKPNAPLQRDEAAAYIWNGLSTHLPVSSSSVSSSSSSSSVTRSSSSSSVASTGPVDKVLDINVPFADRQNFPGKKSFSYRFTLDASMVVRVKASMSDGTGVITCRLYEIGADGFSSRYYLGLQERGTCVIRAALIAGNYQLQLSSTIPDASYGVEVATVTGDGNDGFTQAESLPIEKVRTAALDAEDQGDFYTFTVFKDAKTVVKGGRDLTVSVTSTSSITCLVFPMDDVDLFGFTEPTCNASFTYPPGTYIINVRHGPPIGATQTYTVQIR